MNKPYLILRLLSPYDPLPKPWPKSAKGYYLQERKRAPDPARSEFIRNALSCDYMGSSEFEFGSVPKAFRAMALRGQKGELETREMTFYGHPATPRGDAPGKPRTTKAWVIAPKTDFPELEPLLKEMAHADFSFSFQTKEVPYIQEGLFGKIDKGYKEKKASWQESRYIGWFDLDNHWFLSKSKEQVDALLYLLGLPT
jgi:hypothetical protein